LFHIANDDDRTWWNIGGWNNTQDAVQNGADIDVKPGQIEAGRWYDLCLEVSGRRVKCYLDGRLVHDVEYEDNAEISALYACASHDEKSGDVIVKVVNASAQPLETEVDLAGAKNLTGTETAIVLTSEKATDENSLENSTKVSPQTETIHFSGATLKRSFPGNSFTVLRLQTK
jgi:alpha-L-arabinofuranosidase